MKIMGQILSETLKPTTNANQHDVFFDVLLNAPMNKTQGDEYYWQHQNHMQQSALTFNTLAANTEKPLNNYEDNSGNYPLIKSGTLHTIQQNPSHYVDMQNSVSSKSLPSLKLPIEHLTNVLITMREQSAIQLESRLADNVRKNIISNTTHFNQIVPEKAVFKSWQLFLNDNFAELSLNTTQLSKEETTELHKLIKQWLTEKGYALKQFIINGVSQ